MSRKPGDVAMLFRQDGTRTIGLWGGVNWHCPTSGMSPLNLNTPPRPLLLLDPEDRMQVRKYIESLDKVMRCEHTLIESARIDKFQNAFREMVTPSKREVYEHIVTSAIGKPTVMKSICGKVWTPDPEGTVSVGKCPECRDAITRWES